MFPPVLKSVCLARGYGNRIHIKMIKRNSEIYERERERVRECTHRHWDTSAWFKQLFYTRVNPVIYFFLILRFSLSTNTDV